MIQDRNGTTKFVERTDAGWGAREFRNASPRTDRRPGHIDLGWFSLVRQIGTRETTGEVEKVVVYYSRRRFGRRKRTFVGPEAHRILGEIYRHLI